MKRNVCILVAACVLLAVSCAGGRQKKADGSESPFTVEELRSQRDSLVRAEGTGTSTNVQMATEIARLNAMTVLAGKLSPADTSSATDGAGGVLTREEIDTPVFDVTEVDRRVFRNEKDGTFTVWILLETKK